MESYGIRVLDFFLQNYEVKKEIKKLNTFHASGEDWVAIT